MSGSSPDPKPCKRHRKPFAGFLPLAEKLSHFSRPVGLLFRFYQKMVASVILDRANVWPIAELEAMAQRRLRVGRPEAVGRSRPEQFPVDAGTADPLLPLWSVPAFIRPSQSPKRCRGLCGKEGGESTFAVFYPKTEPYPDRRGT